MRSLPDTDSCNIAKSAYCATGVLYELCSWIVCFGIGGSNAKTDEVFSLFLNNSFKQNCSLYKHLAFSKLVFITFVNHHIYHENALCLVLFEPYNNHLQVLCFADPRPQSYKFFRQHRG